MRAPLLDWHKAMLRASAIGEEIIARRGYQTVPRRDSSNESKELLRRLGIPGWARRDDARYPGLLIPLYRPTGEQIGCQYRPDAPPKDPRTGRPRKYAAQVGRASVVDVHPVNRDRIADPSVPLWITEGVKKADALTTAGLCVASLSGVFNWRSRLGTLGDWEDIPIKGRQVGVCFDADATSNPNVARAMGRLGAWLKAKGAAAVVYCVVPAEVNGTPTKGADDFLAAGGTVELLLAACSTRPPDVAGGTGDAFTDARMAETVAVDVLDGRFVWAAGLGWLEWDGRRWRECSDRAVVEAVRGWTLDQHAAAAERMRTGATDALTVAAWLKRCSAASIRSVVGLAAGIVERDAGDFDAQPDLLNTPSGIVDLRSGQLLAHDPDLLMTKMTGAGYVPGARHPDWDKALEAIPAECRAYAQLRYGQAATGHMTPDDVLLVQQGEGENGKTSVAAGLKAALGDYQVLLSDRVILADPSQHPTELMDLRGARLGLIEETPETKRLSVVRLKKVVGTPQVTARRIRQDPVTFDATHTVMLSTNYRPVVEESDHGTWRRLMLLRYPYRFRKPHEPLEADTDRRGDPGLRQRVATDELVAQAALTWLVDGARAWYALNRVMPEPPARVTADTRAWRHEADLVLAYSDERLAWDQDAHVMSAELLDDFCAWLLGRGHRAWSAETFAARFAGHSEVAAHHVGKTQLRRCAGLSRRPAGGLSMAPVNGVPAKYHAWTGVRFQTDDEDVGTAVSRSTNQDHVPGVPTSPVNALEDLSRSYIDGSGHPGQASKSGTCAGTIPCRRLGHPTCSDHCSRQATHA